MRGSSSAAHACAAALALAAMLLASACAAQGFDLDALAAQRQRVATSSARFHETRRIATLTAPIERTGTLVYRRPDHLEMTVVTPRAELFTIDGATLRLRNADGDRTLSLDSAPALLAWTEGLRATLAGDLAALTRHFVPTLSGSAAAWTLTLEPRDALLRAQVATIVIDGGGDAIRRIDVRETNGDDALMEIVASPAAQP